MTKYGGYALIGIAVLVLIYRFDIIIETFKGTDHIPYYQLLTPLVLLVVGIIVLRIHFKKKKEKEKKDEPDSD
jgi:hypothetical protein